MKKFFSLMLVLAFAFSITSIALAQVPGQVITPGAVDPNQLGNQGTVTTTASLVGKIMDLVNWAAWFVGLAAVVMGLYAGILFITAAGDSAKVSTARSILLYAIIGIAVAVLAFSLVAISKSIFTL